MLFQRCTKLTFGLRLVWSNEQLGLFLITNRDGKQNNLTEH